MGTRSNVLHGISLVRLDGADVGYTDGGVEVEKAVEIFEKMVDQELDAIDVVPTKYSMFVRTTMAEATLENLKIIWNEPEAIVTAGNTRTLYLGYQQTIPDHLLEFVGSSPEGYTRTYTLYRAKQITSSAHTLQKEDKVVFPVEFRCLPDWDRDIGKRYGKIVDVTGP